MRVMYVVLFFFLFLFEFVQDSLLVGEGIFSWDYLRFRENLFANFSKSYAII